jgi:hypothetical protein
VTKLAEIQEAILQLDPKEQQLLRHWLDETAEETPEMLAALDEGIRSLAEKGSREYSRAELEQKVRRWAGGSP